MNSCSEVCKVPHSSLMKFYICKHLCRHCSNWDMESSLCLFLSPPPPLKLTPLLTNTGSSRGRTWVWVSLYESCITGSWGSYLRLCLQFGWFICEVGGASKGRLLRHTWPRDFPVKLFNEQSLKWHICQLSQDGDTFTYLSQTQRKMCGNLPYQLS